MHNHAAFACMEALPQSMQSRFEAIVMYATAQVRLEPVHPEFKHVLLRKNIAPHSKVGEVVELNTHERSFLKL